MNSLDQELQNLLGGGALQQISSQLGLQPEQTSQAINMVLPTLLQAMNKNVQSPGGAQSLFNAISQDHDGSLLDMLPQFLGDANQGSGAGILKHLLGEKQNAIESQISQNTGIGSANVSQLMITLAPILMGLLGKQQKTQGFDISTLVNLIGGTAQAQRQQNSGSPAMDIVKNFIDKDGDGNIQDEMMDIGKKFLGNLFKK